MKIERIVLVDDSESDNVYHELILRRAGFDGELAVFEQGEHALDYLAAQPQGPDCVILLDINMPGMDGWAFAEAVKALMRSDPTVIVVMLTSSGADSDRERAASLAQIQGYLTKPLTVEQAKQLLNRRWVSA